MNMKIGIYGSSTQTGGEHFSQILSLKDIGVYGYARDTGRGKDFVDEVQYKRGIKLERFEDGKGTKSHFIPLGDGKVGHSIHHLVEHSNIIVIAHPSQYILENR